MAFFQRALAIALAVTVCRQLGPIYTPLSLFLPSNSLTEAADSMIALAIGSSTLFFTWHIAGPLPTDPSTSSTANLNLSRSVLGSIVLVLAVCGDSLFKRVALALIVGVCWTLGWKVTTVGQRESYGKFLKQGMLLKLLELWQKGNN
ncbi:hypothetical protein BJX99DRAFT_238161 [Aspergillus californicus]